MATIIRLKAAQRPKPPGNLSAAGRTAWLDEMAKDRFRRLDPFQKHAIVALARLADQITVSEQLASVDPDYVAILADQRELLRELSEFLEATRREPWMPLERSGRPRRAKPGPPAAA